MPTLEIDEFLRKHDSGDFALLDSRSPAEYAAGHLPGALSLPLFDNAERAEIGTLYKQVSADEAFLRGLELVGPKMRLLVERSRELSSGFEAVGLYCWRGGARSASLSWLLESSGMKVFRLIGGYKAYRRAAQSLFSQNDFRFLVLDGQTGSGKTAILQELANLGAQVLDLEALAVHKGSAFGQVPGTVQPTTEQFENNLFETLRRFDPSQPVWVENESRHIGKIYLPDAFVSRLSTSSCIELVVSREQRLERVLEEYGTYPSAHLIQVFQRLTKRLGGLAVKQAIEAIEAGNLVAAASIALDYYDKGYDLYRSRQEFINRLSFQTQGLSSSEIVNKLRDAFQS